MEIDGVTPHTGKGNLHKLRAARSAGGWNFVFDVQASNSPDLNKLDLDAQGSEDLVGATPMWLKRTYRHRWQNNILYLHDSNGED